MAGLEFLEKLMARCVFTTKSYLVNWKCVQKKRMCLTQKYKGLCIDLEEGVYKRLMFMQMGFLNRF